MAASTRALMLFIGSMTVARARVVHTLAVDQNELPLVSAVAERERCDPPDRRACFAVELDEAKRVRRRAPGADDELADAARRIVPPVRVLRREALVRVIVA